VEHNVEDCVAFADRFVLLGDGKIELSGTPEEFLENEEKLKERWVRLPHVTELSHMMIKNEDFYSKNLYLTLDQAYESVEQLLRRQGFGGKKEGS